jgi:hypothetical protein
MPRHRHQLRLRSHEQGTTNGTTPHLMCGLIDVSKAGRVFATDVATDGAAAGRTIVQFVTCIAVIVPTAVAKVLDLVVNTGTAFARSLPSPPSLSLPPR